MFETLPAELRRFNVLYLDDDPVFAAKSVADQHIGAALLWAAQILSNAWWACSLPHDDQVDAVLVLDWANVGQAPYQCGNFSYAALFGQRIYPPQGQAHPACAWAAAMGGNYNWLYMYASELCAIYHALGRIHAVTPCIRALEFVPPKLLDSLDKYYEAPYVGPAECDVHEASTSYRNYYRNYNLKNQHLHYTTRTRPAWI